MLTTTRRSFALAGLPLIAATRISAQESEAKRGITASRAIHQEEDFSASPKRTYEALLDAKQFRTLTGMDAEMHPEVGGTFKLFGGQIVGRNVELIPDRRIVQAWRPAGWPEGVYSIARFELEAHGTGTRIVFDHTGFPSKSAESLADGWHEHYWAGLRKL